MSGHSQGTSSARLLKSSPSASSSSKPQGPMKATIPMSSLLKQNSSLRKSISPASSPTFCWRTSAATTMRTSPDHSGQRSPGSAANRGKARTLGISSNGGIRRTASLDTIYLKGQWPRDNIYCMPPSLQIDKATQTDECDWLETRKIHFIQDPDDKLDKYIRQRLQRSNNQQPPSGRSQVSPSSVPVIGDHTLTTSSQTNTSCIITRAMPVNIPIKPLPKPTLRSSVEGLNQEIERLVLRSCAPGAHNSERNEDYDKFCQVTPEGHRAPLPEMFRNTRSVNTQTPSANDLTGSCHSSGPPSRDSISPMIAGQLDTSPSETGGSRGSTPDQEGCGGRLGTSPHIFLARGPPDGCERVVHLKSADERRSLPLDRAPQPCTFQLKPSQGSAFKILQPNLHPSTKQDLPLVPSEQDLI